jgi:hypothetical protein
MMDLDFNRLTICHLVMINYLVTGIRIVIWRTALGHAVIAFVIQFVMAHEGRKALRMDGLHIPYNREHIDESFLIS